MNKIFEIMQQAVSDDSLRPYLVGPTMSLTVGEVFQLSRQIAAKLRLEGLNHESRVLLQLPNELMVITTWALAHEGIATATFSFTNPILNEFTHIISTSPVDPIDGIKTIYISENWLKSSRETQPRIRPKEFNQSSNFRYFFTSGSTGKPKAVTASVDLFLKRLEQAEATWLAQKSMVLLGSGSFPFWMRIFAALRAGEPVLIPSDAASNLKLAEMHRPELVIGSPAQIIELFEQVDLDSKRYFPRRILATGGPLPKKFANKLMADFQVEVLSFYGSTEVGITTIRNHSTGNSSNIGFPISGVEVDLVDEQGNSVPRDKVGRIRIKSKTSVGCYFGEKSDKFRGEFFYPGDLGHFEPDGSLVIDGREDLVVNLGGVKITFAEIENSIMNFEGIQDVAAFLFETELGIETFGVLIKTTNTFNPASEIVEIQNKLGEKSPKRFVQVAEIPKISEGKNDYVEVARIGKP